MKSKFDTLLIRIKFLFCSIDLPGSFFLSFVYFWISNYTVYFMSANSKVFYLNFGWIKFFCVENLTFSRTVLLFECIYEFEKKKNLIMKVFLQFKPFQTVCLGHFSSECCSFEFKLNFF